MCMSLITNRLKYFYVDQLITHFYFVMCSLLRYVINILPIFFLLTKCLHLCDITQMDILKRFKNQKIKTKANPNTAQNTTKKRSVKTQN